MKLEITCIACPRGCSLEISRTAADGEIAVKGNLCSKGKDYGIREITNPVRLLTSTVSTEAKEQPRVSVRTSGEIPKGLIFPAMKVVHSTVVGSPVVPGDIIVKNLLDTGIDLISTGVWDGR